MSKLKDRLESVSTDIRENFNKSERFIELIEAIGFVEIQSNKYHYNGYSIRIWSINTTVINNVAMWSMSVKIDDSTGIYTTLLNDGINRWDRSLSLENNQKNFSMCEIGLLEKHFKSELRDLRLKELGL